MLIVKIIENNTINKLEPKNIAKTNICFTNPTILYYLIFWTLGGSQKGPIK